MLMVAIIRVTDVVHQLIMVAALAVAVLFAGDTGRGAIRAARRDSTYA